MANIKENLLVTSCFTREKDNLDNTNSIILPKEILEKIVNKKLDKYFFKLRNCSLGLESFCSVMEFSAPQNSVILPYWLMEDLALDENSQVEVEVITNIIKGSKVILEPLDKSFFNIPESDVILESVLSKFSLLQFNSVIKIDIMDKKYFLKIKDISHDYSVMFNDQGVTENQEDLLDINMDVIDIINVDLEVELYNSFLAKELEQKRKEEEEQKIRREIEAREKLEQDIKNKKEDKARLEKEKEKKKETISKYGTKNNFIPFSGKGHRLGD